MRWNSNVLSVLVLTSIHFTSAKPTTANPNRMMFVQVLTGKFVMPDTPESRSKPRPKHKIPDMSRMAKECPKKSFYFAMNPAHMEAVAEVESVLKSSGTSVEDSLSMAMELKNNSFVNPKVWYRALSNFAYANPLFDSMVQPSPIQTMPDVFISADVLKKLRAQVDLPTGQRSCVILDGATTANNGPESPLWYFREDIFLNAHHWFFHIANPIRYLVNIDRRGELFYYMHHQMLARYNAERLAHGFPLTTQFKPVHDTYVQEGYSPNLQDMLSGSMWTARVAGVKYDDVIHLQNPNINRDIMISDLEAWAERIFGAIEDMVLKHKDGRKIPMTSWKSIDLLGDLVQAANHSVNPAYYGELGLHNNGHLVLGLIMDPLYKKMLPSGVMTDEGTAIRDPIFYRWHTFIDHMFNTYLEKLEPHRQQGGEFPLHWDGVAITDLDVQTPNLQDNELHTFFKLESLALPRGLDFVQVQNSGGAGTGTMKLCYKHLDHKPFTYRIGLERNPSSKSGKATIRLFLAPRFKLNGKRFTIAEQRHLFFLLDVFKVILKPGKSTLNLTSTSSNFAINPMEIIISLSLLNETKYEGIKAKEAYCGCGWPQHLVLPRGTVKGMTFDLFAFVTNGIEDEVKDTAKSRFCRSPYIICGVPGKKYPDSKPMHYPFERMPCKSIPKDGTLDDFMKGVGNMRGQQVTIKHIGDMNSNCCQSHK